MNELELKNISFNEIHSRTHRLSAAVFIVSNVISQDEELKAKIKSLSLSLISMSVNLKDTNSSEISKTINDMEKNVLELMSMLELASVAGMISKMNGDILKQEFQLFMSDLLKFSENFHNRKSANIKEFFSVQVGVPNTTDFVSINTENKNLSKEKNMVTGNGHKRKDFRKSAVLEFIKGHNNVSIKDIIPNVTGCSEKTIQRELVSLINEGIIIKTGERRWSRYSVA